MNNIIDQIAPPSSPNSNRGIHLSASDSAVVSCNIINSTYNTGSAHSYGIRVETSTYCTVGCNEVYDQYNGFYWGGTCSNSSFYGNEMNDHYVGLHLNQYAVIGQQPDSGIAPYHGNSWLDTTHYLSGYGAVNLNDATLASLQASLFTTNQGTAAHNPKRPLNPGSGPFNGVDNGQWFDEQLSGIYILR
ncbi:MAG: hypothetical protein IPP71_23480 [Bacteroidetes bacterium]|nr:hypothetical protein [Bacteroidota bacterium]